MTRVTFHFVPENIFDKENLDLNTDHPDISSVNDDDDPMQSIQLSGGELIEIGPLGTIRYSVSDNPIDNISSEYEASLERIDNLIDGLDSEYSLHLLVDSDSIEEIVWSDNCPVDNFLSDNFDLRDFEMKQVSQSSLRVSPSKGRELVKIQA